MLYTSPLNTLYVQLTMSSHCQRSCEMSEHLAARISNLQKEMDAKYAAYAKLTEELADERTKHHNTMCAQQEERIAFEKQLQTLRDALKQVGADGR